MKNIFLPMRNL